MDKNWWRAEEMTGTLGVTTVPLPAFWSKDDGDQHRRSPRKEHPCQHPRCAANSMACSTLHKEPPAKRIKRPLNNTKQDHLAPVTSTGRRTELETCGGIKALGNYAANFSGSHFPKNSSPVSSRSIRPEWGTCGGIKAFGNNTGRRNSHCRSSQSLSTISSEASRTELEICRGIKEPGNHSGKYLHGHFGKNLGTIFPKGTRTELETCGGIRAFGSRAGELANSKVRNIACTVSSRTKTELDYRGETIAHGSPARKYANCTAANNLCPASSKGTRNELENCRAIKAHLNNVGKHTDYEIALAPRTVAEIRGPFSVIGNDSKESTTPISSSSHAPSIPTPIRRPPKPSKMGLAPQSVLEGSMSTGSSSPCSQSLPACCLSESMYNTMDDQITPSFLRGGRIAPPNSKKDEEEEPPIEEIDRHKPPLALLLYNALPVVSSSTSRWPPGLPTEADPIGRPVNLASNKNSATSNLPPLTLTGVPATMPRESSTKCTRATPVRCSSSLLLSKSCEGQSGSSFRFGNSEATTKNSRATTIHRSSSPLVSKASGVHTGSSTTHLTPKIKHMKRRRTLALNKNAKNDKSTRSSTLATTGSAAQMCILEQRLEDEDRQSNSSHSTLGSDSPQGSSCMDLSSTRCGSKPISAFYNALYAPDCTLSGTKALEENLHRYDRGVNATLRVALEITMFSVIVPILLLVFYPAITKELRSQFYDCCPCAEASGSAVPQNPSQHYPQVSSNYGSCVYKGEENLMKCSPSQRTMGSTVVK